jgi:hypothetical protein
MKRGKGKRYCAFGESFGSERCLKVKEGAEFTTAMRMK